LVRRKVFTDWKNFEAVYGDILSTHLFYNPMQAGEEVEVQLYTGNALIIKLVSIGEVREDGLKEGNARPTSRRPWREPCSLFFIVEAFM